jgi:hypothetical protein
MMTPGTRIQPSDDTVEEEEGEEKSDDDLDRRSGAEVAQDGSRSSQRGCGGGQGGSES